jgi:hypothetical protein
MAPQLPKLTIYRFVSDGAPQSSILELRTLEEIAGIKSPITGPLKEAQGSVIPDVESLEKSL